MLMYAYVMWVRAWILQRKFHCSLLSRLTLTWRYSPCALSCIFVKLYILEMCPSNFDCFRVGFWLPQIETKSRTWIFLPWQTRAIIPGTEALSQGRLLTQPTCFLQPQYISGYWFAIHALASDAVMIRVYNVYWKLLVPFGCSSSCSPK